MYQRFRASLERDEGFTLIELLVVIIIIGILAAIAIPVFLNQRKKGYDAQVKSDLHNAATAEETWLTNNGKYSTLVTDLNSVGFKSSANDTFSIVSVRSLSGTDQAGSYCLKGVSSSGSSYYWDSNGAGPGVDTTACT